LSIGSGYRIAQVFTEDHAALTGAREVLFLNDLEPERSWNINLNYVYQLYLKQGHILDFDASVFRTDFSNKIVPNYDTDPNLIIYDNLSRKSVTQGMSMNFNSLFRGGLRINLGATYIDSYLESAGSKTRPYLTERFQGVWKIEQKFRESNLTFDLTGNITGPLKLPLLGTLDPRDPYSPTFSIINIQLTKGWNNRYEFYGGVKNLLNFTPAKNSIARAFDPFDREVQFDALGNLQPSAGNPYALTFDPTYVYASNQGIRFFMGFRWSLN
jgi:outer membrane receptor for ferrienterochelin and colicins